MDMNGTRRWVVAVTVAAMTGCWNDGDSTQSGVGGNTTSAASPPLEPDALRVRKDPARNRLWVLTYEGVRIYDAATRNLVAAVGLPSWTAARFPCEPDLVLDGSGSAIVSSNVEARLWWIDADSLAVTAREVVLAGREHWDTGFAAIVYAADGSLLALTSTAGSLWKVDLARGVAQMVDPDAALSNACEIGGSTNNLARSQS